MPHATSMPSPGFQAVILCGPGISLNTFTSNPEDFPKALVPIANRPMVWYPLEWCHRMGITKIHLITPPSSANVLEAALSQNPHLTSLPLPRADILAPDNLTHTTGTAEIFRLPEVHAAITSDFVVLPCDLVCELPGERLLDSWMVQQSSFGGTRNSEFARFDRELMDKRDRRRGGLGVWFESKGEDSVKGNETDFIITSTLPQPSAPPPPGSLRPHLSKLLYAIATDTLRDITQEKGGLPLRNGLIQKHAKLRMLSTYRAAHIYLFPYWVLDMIKRNEKFDSISEDVIGWWAKAGWQDGLAQKLRIHEALDSRSQKFRTGSEMDSTVTTAADDLDHRHLSSTYASTPPTLGTDNKTYFAPPPIISYIHPHHSPNLIRRVDTPALLLSTSLYLASLPPSTNPMPTAASTPLSHPHKISTDPSLIAAHTTIEAQSTLIGPNTSVARHCTIMSSCIGANCVIAEGAKITGCVVMDGALVEAKVQLQACLLGRRCVVGKGAKLEGCEVQEGFRVGDGAVGSKGDKFCTFEGLEGGLTSMGEKEDEVGNDESLYHS